MEGKNNSSNVGIDREEQCKRKQNLPPSSYKKQSQLSWKILIVQ